MLLNIIVGHAAVYRPDIIKQLNICRMPWNVFVYGFNSMDEVIICFNEHNTINWFLFLKNTSCMRKP